MLETYFLFVVLLVFGVVFAVFADKKDDIKYVLIIIIAFSFLSGFRSYSVGIDTISYSAKFTSIANGASFSAIGFEESFAIISSFLLNIIPHPSFLFIVYSAIINTFILLRLWDFRKISSFPWMAVCYYVSFYFMTFNIMRQMCAIAIVFFATRYIQKQKYLPFLLCAAIAFLFHKSSVISMGFLVIELLQWKYLSVKNRRVIGAILLTGLLGLLLFLNKFIAYARYLNNISFNFGFMLIAKIVLFIISSLGLSSVVRKKNNRDNDKYVYELNFIRLCYIAGILLTSLGYIFPYLDRIGLVYYLFECVYFGIIVKKGQLRKIYSIVVGLLLTYVFANALFKNGQGVLPYTFVWQTSRWLAESVVFFTIFLLLILYSGVKSFESDNKRHILRRETVGDQNRTSKTMRKVIKWI